MVQDYDEFEKKKEAHMKMEEEKTEKFDDFLVLMKDYLKSKEEDREIQKQRINEKAYDREISRENLKPQQKLFETKIKKYGFVPKKIKNNNENGDKTGAVEGNKENASTE